MESATRTDDEEEEQDGSSTFSVIKEPPRKREKQSRQLEQVKSTRQKKTPKTSESKEEHTIKKLKSYVTACGVRKVWVKEFKDTPQPQKQIARLKQILQELGMTGRPSMGQARKIKEQRELMQDLEEVSAFSRRIGAEKGPNGGAQRAYEIPDDTADDTGDVPQVNPKKTVFGSKRSITAFLDEQSD